MTVSISGPGATSSVDVGTDSLPELTLNVPASPGITMSMPVIDVTLAVAGVQGPVGPAGPAAGKMTYVAAIAQTVWTITHNLGFYPQVTTFDTTDEQIMGDVRHINGTTVTVTFGVPVSGVAYLS